MRLKSVYICSECGYEAARWLGRCPSCGSFNTLNEEIVEQLSKAEAAKSTKRAAVVSAKPPDERSPKSLTDIKNTKDERAPTNIGELDRVLSGGLVTGSLTLIGGEPGIGKSTILLQICQNIKLKGKILYVSGEESLVQLKMRAERLGVDRDGLFFLSETDVGVIDGAITDTSPSLVIVDSIQTTRLGELNSAPGSVTQVRESAAFFMRVAKERGITVILVGHVTKEGALAGPRVLEHMVDTVLYFEGERKALYRVIRAVKNRFGATDEIGVFEMTEDGLTSIANPSEFMLMGRAADAAGSVVACSVEGTRPLLTEVQALTAFTSFGTPRRTATGFDFNRFVMLLAVLEKRAGLKLGQFDAYLNIVGGMKVNEPSIDLAAVAAVASAFRNKPVNRSFVAFGEVGLAGEVRAVIHADRRVAEAEKMGFTEIAAPFANIRGIKKREGIRVYGVSNVGELLDLL